jgi:hypothetical protein
MTTLDKLFTAQDAREHIRASLASEPGRTLPTLPFPLPEGHTPGSWAPSQAEADANFLVVATWIVEFDAQHLDMATWHADICGEIPPPDPDYAVANAEDLAHRCGTTHCIAGFAQAMGGPGAFFFHPWHYACAALRQPKYVFFSGDDWAMDYMRQFIADHEDAAMSTEQSLAPLS